MKDFSIKPFCLLFLLTVVLLCCNSGCNESNSIDPVDVAKSHIAYLSESIGPRIAGSEEELRAQDYIAEEFKGLGFFPEIQSFAYEDGDNSGLSYNVIALLQGASPQEIIIGAHYDSVGIGQGATDNASGVALMLVIMQQLKNENLPYTLRFIAFGAEEIGLWGSWAYADGMSTDEVNNTLGMVNLE